MGGWLLKEKEKQKHHRTDQDETSACKQSSAIGIRKPDILEPIYIESKIRGMARGNRVKKKIYCP